MAPGRRPNGSGMWLPGGTRPAPERLRDVAPGYHLDRSRTGAQTYLYPGLSCGTGTRVSAAGHSILFAATYDADLCHLFCPGAKNRAFSFAPGQKTKPPPLPRGKEPSFLLLPRGKKSSLLLLPRGKNRASSFCPGAKAESADMAGRTPTVADVEFSRVLCRPWEGRRRSAATS